MLFKMISLTGMLAGIALVITFALGILHLDIELHELSAFITLGLGVIHFSLILYKNWKIRHPRKQNN